VIIGVAVDVLCPKEFLMVHGKKIDGYYFLVGNNGGIVVAVTLALIAQALFKFLTYIIIDFH